MKRIVSMNELFFFYNKNKYIGGINIKFDKHQSLKVSEEFFVKLEEKIGGNKLDDAYYETFNNDREQGLVLKLYKGNTNLFIWSCECRDSDDIMIVIGCDEHCDIYNMFDNKAYNRAKYFKVEDYDSAVDYVYKQLKYFFKDYMYNERHFKFDTYKNMEDIRKIEMNVNDLNYDDYYELASFFDEDEQYSCDLIILNGAIGYRYNKHFNDELENLTFEATNPNLENEIKLMIDMQEKLNNFMENELLYSIELDNENIKI